MGGPADLHQAVAQCPADAAVGIAPGFHRVDQCFVTGDADGIRAIKKDAEENKELSGWNKLRIINECTAALVELRLSGQES